MIESPEIGIELPLKIIAWREDQKTILAVQNVDKLIVDYQITKSIATIKLLKSFLFDLVESIIKTTDGIA